jgi:hypothetical protein
MMDECVGREYIPGPFEFSCEVDSLYLMMVYVPHVDAVRMDWARMVAWKGSVIGLVWFRVAKEVVDWVITRVGSAG